jgi:hypothetical protein
MFLAPPEETELHFSFHVGLNTASNSILEQQTYSPLYVVQIKELPSGESLKGSHLNEILFKDPNSISLDE